MIVISLRHDEKGGLRHNGGPEILVWRILEQGTHF